MLCEYSGEQSAKDPQARLKNTKVVDLKTLPEHLRIEEIKPVERFPQAGLGNQKYWVNGIIRKKFNLSLFLIKIRFPVHTIR